MSTSHGTLHGIEDACRLGKGKVPGSNPARASQNFGSNNLMLSDINSIGYLTKKNLDTKDHGSAVS